MTFLLIALTAICGYAGLRKFVKNGKEIDVLTAAIYMLSGLFFFLLAVTTKLNIFSVPVTEETPIFQFKSMGGALAVIYTFLLIFFLCLVQGWDKIKKKKMA